MLLSYPLFLSSIFSDSVYFLFHFLPFPSLSPFSSPSLSRSLSLSLLTCHGITSYRSPAACHLHQAAGASSSGRQPLRAHVSVSTLARVHTHTRVHTCSCIYAHRHGTSPRQVGIQMDTDVTAVARFSTHRPLRSPFSPLAPGSGTHSA